MAASSPLFTCLQWTQCTQITPPTTADVPGVYLGCLWFFFKSNPQSAQNRSCRCESFLLESFLLVLPFSAEGASFEAGRSRRQCMPVYPRCGKHCSRRKRWEWVGSRRASRIRGSSGGGWGKQSRPLEVCPGKGRIVHALDGMRFRSGARGEGGGRVEWCLGWKVVLWRSP